MNDPLNNIYNINNIIQNINKINKINKITREGDIFNPDTYRASKEADWCKKVYEFLEINYDYIFGIEGLPTIVSTINCVSIEMGINPNLIKDKFEKELSSKELAEIYNINENSIKDILERFKKICNSKMRYFVPLTHGVYEIYTMDKELEKLLYNKYKKANWDKDNYYVFLGILKKDMAPSRLRYKDVRILNMLALSFMNLEDNKVIAIFASDILKLYNYKDLCTDIRNNKLKNELYIKYRTFGKDLYDTIDKLIKSLEKLLDDFDPHRKLLLLN